MPATIQRNTLPTAQGSEVRTVSQTLIFDFHAYNTNTFCRLDPNTNLLYPSKTLFLKTPPTLTTNTLRTLSMLGLTELTLHETNGTVLESTNLTILNYLLLRLGPMSEKSLVKTLIVVQVRLSQHQCRKHSTKV